MLLNNLCECVNGDKTVLIARCLPIYSMLEMIMVKIIERRASRRQDMEKSFGEIGPRIAEILEIAAKNSGSLTAHWGGNGNFQINDNDDTTSVAVVGLAAKTYPLSYVHDHYKKSTQKKIWQNVIHGIKMEKYWNKSELPPLLPPKIVKQAGRPKKLRYRGVSEIPANARKFTRIHRSYTCTKCKQQGHSFKTCDKRVELLAKIHKHNLNQHIVVNQQPAENQQTETSVDVPDIQTEFVDSNEVGEGV
ncbi:hypothetical protein Dsin_022303 [Dipteronia sinensis]|uniref:Uncharacterized protein n=1 Tax=Dipteronia sinensis TaxID=43782 RepID=A0AAE0A1H7_9ROSI|nr:hypothetical protein Dsin_022303 [Dipteronia sinensis]